MPTFIYCPVMTGEMAHLAAAWNQGRIAKGKAPYTIIGAGDTGIGKGIRRIFGGHLSDVGGGDKLYVLAHGRMLPGEHGALIIGVKRGAFVLGGSLQGYTVQGGHWKSYTPPVLARHFEKEGLTKGIVDLRLFCCGAELATQQNGVAVQPFAQRLKAAMVARGYNAVTVTGYLGDLSPQHQDYFAPGTMQAQNSLGVGKGVTLPGDTYRSRARDHRVHF